MKVRPCVLVLDRQSALPADLIEHLMDAGFDILAVDDCHGAYLLIRDERPVAAIIGRLSEHVTKTEACRLLRSVAPIGTTAIIAIAPASAERTRIGCLDEGADYIEDEPVDPKSLLWRLNALVKRPVMARFIDDPVIQS